MSVEDPLIRVLRKLSGEELEEEAMTWEAAIQQVEEMVEYSSSEASPYQVLTDMIQLVDNEQLHAIKWAVGPHGQKLLNQWLNFKGRDMPVSRGTLLGLPIIEIGSLPNEVLILLASRWGSAGPEETSFAVKTVIEVRDVEQRDNSSSKTPDSGRNHSGEYSAPTGGLATTPKRLSRIQWPPASVIGEPVGND
jgi:hypothetical protein